MDTVRGEASGREGVRNVKLFTVFVIMVWVVVGYVAYANGGLIVAGMVYSAFAAGFAFAKATRSRGVAPTRWH
jgi:hypothetical protein